MIDTYLYTHTEACPIHQVHAKNEKKYKVYERWIQVWLNVCHTDTNNGLFICTAFDPTNSLFAISKYVGLSVCLYVCWYILGHSFSRFPCNIIIGQKRVWPNLGQIRSILTSPWCF